MNPKKQSAGRTGSLAEAEGTQKSYCRGKRMDETEKGEGPKLWQVLSINVSVLTKTNCHFQCDKA